MRASATEKPPRDKGSGLKKNTAPVQRWPGEAGFLKTWTSSLSLQSLASKSQLRSAAVEGEGAQAMSTQGHRARWATDLEV